MRALVVTPALLPRPGLDVSAVYLRHRMFLHALTRVVRSEGGQSEGGPADGGRIDIVHLVPPATIAANADAAALSRQQSDFWGCEVTVSLVPRRTREETFAAHYLAGILAAAGQKPFYPFAGAAQAAAVRRHLERDPDIVVAFNLNGMLPVLGAGIRPRALFFDIDDVQHRVLLRACLRPPARPGKFATLAQLPALIAAERRCARLARQSFVCSELDRRHLMRLGIARDVAVVPNAVALPEAPPPPAAEPTLMLLGACHYPPNAEAAERLALRILPLIRREMPRARLLLAGDGSDRLASAGAEHVEHLGFVADLPGLYARSRVVCAPIVNGGGTRTKLVEAAAYARPMVATRIGAEGLAFVDGEHILLRDSDADIAAACVRLLRDDALAARLGAAARTRMRTLYEAGSIRDSLAARFAATLTRHA